MTRRGRRRTARPADHRKPRVEKRGAPPRAITSKLTICLWSLAGILVKRLDAYGTVDTAPAFNMLEGVRYVRMNPHPPRSRVVHYRAER